MADYADLKADIQQWIENTDPDLVANLDTICGNAQRMVYRDMKLAAHNVTLPGTLVIGDPIIPVPDDLLALQSFSITLVTGEQVVIDLRDQQWLIVYWPDPTVTGTPKYLGIDDFSGTGASIIRNWRIAPTPSATLAYQINYRAMPAVATADADTNWLFTNAYECLLYASMAEAAAFVMDDRQQSLITLYGGKYRDAKSLVMADDDTVRTATFRETVKPVKDK